MSATNSSTLNEDIMMLRFTTAGSVDDGKSTLIGRLLYDSKSIFEDQLEAAEHASKRRGDAQVNLALLTDGLRAEREQGITIDVAYRYFATPRRKFIIADTPGHIQYTRNMVTGASTADLAIVLVDARKGVIEQTCRHTFIANLLGIQHVVFAINKMDLVDYQQDIFEKIKDDLTDFISRMGSIIDVNFIPISALRGDNVVNKSENMRWHQGTTLLYHLESVYVGGNLNRVESRFPVQWVIRPHSKEHHDFRGYAGRVAGGVFKPGDKVMALPSGFSTKIAKIFNSEDELQEAFAPMSVCMTLEDEIDISRGDMIVKENRLPRIGQDIKAMICWFSQKPLQVRGKYALKHTSKDARCIIKEVLYKVNINTLHKIEDEKNVVLNEIACIKIRSSEALFHDAYRKNRNTGAFILIDELNHETVAAGMII